MKNVILFLTALCLSVTSISGQVKIQSMPTHNAKPTSAWIPIVAGGVNKKVRADSIAAIANAYTDVKADSLKDYIDSSLTASASSVTTVKVSISSAEILNLNSVPKTLVAAPGAGKIIVPLSLLISKFFVTTAYTGSTSFTFGPGTVFTTSISSSLGFTQDSFEKVGLGNGGEHSNAAYGANVPLNIFVNGSNPASGDGNIIVYVTYTIINL